MAYFEDFMLICMGIFGAFCLISSAYDASLARSQGLDVVGEEGMCMILGLFLMIVGFGLVAFDISGINVFKILCFT